jgi:hypothetical protein
VRSPKPAFSPGNLEDLMLGLSRVVSTNPADAAANDALLSGLKAELPSYISDIVVARPDGEITGSAFGRRYAIGDRTFFHQVEAVNRLRLAVPSAPGQTVAGSSRSPRCE